MATEPLTTIDLAKATPDERAAVARLRNELEGFVKFAKARLNALDARALLAFEKLGADQLPLTGGTLTVQRPPAHYEINDEQLRRDLLELAKSGALTEDEVNDAVPAVVEYKSNNTKLNYLARHRGDAVQAAINTHRRKVAGEGSGKVIWPAGKESR